MAKIRYIKEGDISNEMLQSTALEIGVIIKRKMIKELLNSIPNEELFKFFNFQEEKRENESRLDFTSNPNRDFKKWRVSLEIEEKQN